MPPVTIQNVADAISIDPGVTHCNEHSAILKAAIIIGCILFINPMLRQNFIQAAADSTKRCADADGFRNGRRGDGASRRQRAYSGNRKRRDAKASTQRTTSQDPDLPPPSGPIGLLVH
jgi:hypothetical protein